jgi:riboflavin kinase/FMN adenylyltransferase
MKVLRSLAHFKLIKSTVVTLGNFDGIHLGHQSILKRLKARARALRCPSVVYTFDPHPLKVIVPDKSPPLILDMEGKIELLKDFGIDYLVLARFTEQFAAKHPDEFVGEVIVDGLKASEVLVGRNFSFGRGRAGNVRYLKTLSARFGFHVEVVPSVKRGGAVVSSSRVRAMVIHGEVRRAGALLGRPFYLKGKVAKGSRIGRSIGFPTANLEVASELVPSNGVYAARVLLGRATHDALVNIGMAPTVKRDARCVEVHLLGFRRSIYGRRMEVAFLSRLRDEQRFATTAALARQIREDVVRARRLFSRV